MYLSVPIPVRNEKTLAVVMLPKIRTRDIVASHRAGTGDDAAAEGTQAHGFALVCFVFSGVFFWLLIAWFFVKGWFVAFFLFSVIFLVFRFAVCS